MSDDRPCEVTSRSHNLPGQPTPLVGRQHELAAVREAVLHESRLLTLTGAPGVGKTRLALAAAESLLAAFPDGAFFVDLAPIGDPTLVVPTIAHVLGVREAGDRPLLLGLQQHLQDRAVLLVLDNFEQVLDARTLIAQLLSCCANLKVLATSRVPLRLRWEHAFPVPLLALPDPASWQDPNYLARVPSVALFVARSRAVNRAFVLGRHNSRAVAGVCAALDGLPLAIELSAAQGDMLPPEEILKGLREHGLDLLATDAADAPARHRTLRGCIDWSYQLLEPAEQQLYRWLAVFVGGATREAVQAVTQDVDSAQIDVARGLAALARKGLVQVQEAAEGERRFRMLEMIRERGLEQLAATGDGEAVRRAHAIYYLRLAEEAAPHFTGPEQQRWLSLLNREHDNLRAALCWFRERGEVEEGLRLGTALWHFWRVRGHYSEGRRQLEELLDSAEESIRPEVRAKALFTAAEMARYAVDYVTCRLRHRQAQALYESIGDKRGSARSLGYQANADFYCGDLASARARAEESVALFREQGDASGLTQSLLILGQPLMFLGEFDLACGAIREGLALSREMGDRWMVANHLCTLSIAEVLQGHSTAARALYIEGLPIALEFGDGFRIANFLIPAAVVAGAEGYHERAIRLAGAAAGIREAIGAPYTEFLEKEFERRLGPAHQALGPRVSAAAWAAGKAMTMQEAIDYALAPEEAADEALAARSIHQRKWGDPLSPREREIAELLAEGLKNEEIAERLIVSRRTVENHVSSILGKLGVTSRSQVVAWVLAQRLPSPESQDETNAPHQNHRLIMLRPARRPRPD